MALGSVATTTAGYGTGFPGPPQAAATDPSNSGNTGGTNGLYLYTFLITLMVLLGVASLIIVRSCILRRRFRRHVQLAIEGGSGLVIPPYLRMPGSAEGGIPIVTMAGRHPVAGRRRKEKVALGAKPVMSEVWMEKEMDEDDEASDEKWPAMIQPISTTLVRPTLPDPTIPTNAPSTTPTTASPFVLTRETAQEYFGVDMRSFREVMHDNWRNTRSNLESIGRTLAPRPRPSSVILASRQGSRPVSQRMNSNSGTPANRQSGIVTPEEDDDLEKRLAVGFLIAMPDARRPTYHSTPQPDHQAFKVDLPQQPSPTSDTFPYSPEELERGKMKALGIAGHDTGSVGGFETDDGELPPVVFGIVDVDWTGRKVPPVKPQTGTGGTHV